MSLLFVACTEPGYLEDQSLVLFRSIRKWAGRYGSSRIVCIQPRRSIGLADTTRAEYEHLGVEHHAISLNVDFEHYPRANKIFAGAWAERHCDEDFIVFIDSDSFIFGEPVELELPDEYSAGVRPALERATNKRNSPEMDDRYWSRLWEICGTRPPPFVETVIGRERVRAYWNAGLVVCRRSDGLFDKWLADFKTLMGAKHFPPNTNRMNMVQTALSATLARVQERVKVLDWRYNYPLHRRDDLCDGMRTAELDQLVHVHYFTGFKDPNLLDSLSPPFNRESERFHWLEQMPLDRLSSPERRAQYEIRQVRARCRRAERKARKAAKAAGCAQRRARRAESRLAAIETSTWFRISRAAGLLRNVPRDTPKQKRVVKPGNTR